MLILVIKVVGLEEYYVVPKEAELYIEAEQDGKTINDEDNYDIDNHELVINNINDLSSKEGLDNTIKITDMINVVFEEPKLLLPEYDVENPTLYLRK